MLKYKIDDLLTALPKKDYDEAVNKIIIEIGVPYSTFQGWRKIKIGEKRDIPAEKLFGIAKFFGKPAEELKNYDVKITPFSTAEEEIKKGLQKRHKIHTTK